jgi:CspA family cold shock protein
LKELTEEVISEVVITNAEEEETEGTISIRNNKTFKIMKGTVKWYDRVKGYGFLQTEDNKDIFVHRSGLEVSHTDLEAGQAVEFEIEQREKGPVAVKVKKVE